MIMTSAMQGKHIWEYRGLIFGEVVSRLTITPNG